jgi:hypothetical protein
MSGVGRRSCEAYCVGACKSGTHSLRDVFRPHYRAEHEPLSKELIPLILRHRGEIAQLESVRRLVSRFDERLPLDMNSSQLNLYLLPALFELRPRARFILTIRDCYSWLESLLHHILTRKVDPASSWLPFRDFRFGRPGSRDPNEAALAADPIAPLAGYFRYWRHHNSSVVELVPRDRLLVVRTDEIGRRLDDIARFVGVPVGTLSPAGAHAFASNRRPGALLDRVSRQYLQALAQTYCEPLMSEIFPDVVESYSSPTRGAI